MIKFDRLRQEGRKTSIKNHVLPSSELLRDSSAFKYLCKINELEYLSLLKNQDTQLSHSYRG